MSNSIVFYLVLALPLAIALLISSKARQSTVVWPLLIALVATSLAFKFANKWERDRLRLSFEKQGTDLVLKCSAIIQDNFTILEAIDSFYRSSKYIDREEFKTFVTPLINKHPYLQALVWVPKVTNEERLAFEKLAQHNGYHAFQITERTSQGVMVQRTEQSVYYPVFYVEPFKKNHEELGYDVASHPLRLLTLTKACETGQAIATAPINLVRESEHQRDFLVFHPIYYKSQSNEALEVCEKNLHGFALGVFNTGDILNAALSNSNDNQFQVAVYDQTTIDNNQLIFSTLKEHTLKHDEPFKQHINVGGRSWMMVIWPNLTYFKSVQSWTPFFVITGGLFFNIFGALFLTMIMGSAAYTKDLVEKRTAELMESNDLLQQEMKKTIQTQKSLEEQRFVAFNIADDALHAKKFLQQRSEELIIKNKELDEFSYLASHDLQEPLRKLTIFCDYLKEDIGDELNKSAEEDIHVITDAASRMKILIQDLLQLSHAGRRELKSEELNLDACIDIALNNLSVLLKEKQAIIVRKDKFPEKIQGDETLLIQLFQNLTENALNYVTTGKVPIVEFTAEYKEGLCVFGVKDNGIGINSTHFDKIFSPFKRLHSNDEVPGTGIGLAICIKAIERHCGDIWVQSVPEQGSHFKFTLWSQTKHQLIANSITGDNTHV